VKNFIYLLGSLVIAITAAFMLRNWLDQYEDPGYVLIGIGHWSLETSLFVFIIAISIFFLILYMGFRLLGWLIRLPGRTKRRRQGVKFNRSQEALISGLVDSAEGNWHKAEKVLIKHAADSGAPLIHYLTAARAAHSRGALEKRDEYLKIAAAEAPGSDIAIGLTEAELHLSEKQFGHALETLKRLHSIDPAHANVLKLMHQTYQHIGDWEGIRKIIPALHKNKVLMEAEVKLLETETYSTLLKQAAERGISEETQELWNSIPKHIQSMHGIRAIYFAAMIESGAGALIESELIKAIEENWDETLLVLFGCIQSEDFQKQLQTGERWLELHVNDTVLLRILGKICIKCGQKQKAEQYLSKSLAIEPTVTAFQMLGDLLFERGDKERASENFKKGLELASSEVVSQVEEFTG
jgi:HemY protein